AHRLVVVNPGPCGAPPSEDRIMANTLTDKQARWIENLGTVSTTQALRLLAESSGGATGPEAKQARKDRIALNNHAFSTNRSLVAPGPKLVTPLARLTNGIRLVA